MGSWSINIQGHGVHDNGLDQDVDRMLLDFVASLRKSGHYVDSANLTVGSGRKTHTVGESDDLTDYRTF